MKKVLFFVAACMFFGMDLVAQQVEYQVVTVVESIIPMGLGRSRIIEETQEPKPTDKITYSHVDGDVSSDGKIRRKDLRINNYEETKLLNFFSAAGISFENIASNDNIISSKLNEMTAKGWELVFTTSAVESDGGETDGQGIFITRFIFKRTK